MARNVRGGNDLDEMVRLISNEMLDGTWQCGPSHRKYSEKYNVAESTVRDWSCAAGRYLRLSAGSTAEIRTRILAQIETIARDARKKNRFIAGLRALEMLGNAYGVLTPDLNEAPTEVTIEDIEEMLRAQGYGLHKLEESNANDTEPAPAGQDGSDTTEPAGDNRDGGADPGDTGGSTAA